LSTSVFWDQLRSSLIGLPHPVEACERSNELKLELNILHSYIFMVGANGYQRSLDFQLSFAVHDAERMPGRICQTDGWHAHTLLSVFQSIDC
jgi:hypothetical protein